jgi:hypothetical protein
MRKKPADRFYDPTTKQKREMLEKVKSTLAKAGLHGIDIKSAFHPTLEISLPKKNRKDGGVNYTTYSISIS